MNVRALYSVLIALTVVMSAFPIYGYPVWQKLNPVPAMQRLSSFPRASASRLIAQTQGPKPHLHGPGPHNGDWLRQNRSLPPAQQEQKLWSDPKFRSLPPEKQQNLLNRLRKFNSLSPQKQHEILNRMETFEHMSPQQQAQAQNLFQRYKGLPPQQQSQVSQAYQKMRSMSPEQRSQYLNSDEFRNSFNPEQQDLLRGMSELYPNPPR